MKGLLHEFSDAFALSDQELGCTDIVRHSIDTEENRPAKQQPYRTAITRRDTIRKMVEQMQRQGVVQPSRSPWASPVVLVPKKDGSLRFCVVSVLITASLIPSHARMFFPCHELMIF